MTEFNFNNLPEAMAILVQKVSNLENLLLTAKNSPKFNGDNPNASTQWINDADAAKMLNICKRQLYNLRVTGVLGFARLNGKNMYKISDIDRLLEKHYVKSFKK
ncbi:MAG: helix-turn-helix domain-containing protein [Bacteroidia bacterium]